MPRSSVLVFAVALLASGVRGGVRPSPPSPAQAPALELTATDGKTIRLADLRGRVVLVDIWASWCAPCKNSFPSLDALYTELQPKGLEVLAVNVDEHRGDADEFLSRHSHQMTVLLDPRGQVPLAFGADAMPSSFLIDRQGNVRFRHTGFTPATLERYRQEIATLLDEPADNAVVVVGH